MHYATPAVKLFYKNNDHFDLFQAGVLDLGTVWQRLRLCLPRQHLLQASRQLQTGD